jgi:hypothetical protein
LDNGFHLTLKLSHEVSISTFPAVYPIWIIQPGIDADLEFSTRDISGGDPELENKPISR